MIENNTTDKKIVSLFTGNKLCNVASRLRGKGFNIICPNHYGLCTANLAEDAVTLLFCTIHHYLPESFDLVQLHTLL
jgi:hypothetical protein